MFCTVNKLILYIIQMYLCAYQPLYIFMTTDLEMLFYVERDSVLIWFVLCLFQYFWNHISCNFLKRKTLTGACWMILFFTFSDPGWNCKISLLIAILALNVFLWEFGGISGQYPQVVDCLYSHPHSAAMYWCY